ncbi:tetratricopeptide repeat-containing glycosyltransferase family protein [Roseomonas sp. E05]|uniref:tetratricopeptide repeat-containing glycosyltransferase family protein n=1 Tax=Roseomonas sp. E05 TaxID=3046310 RepID=UPI0024BADE08|nr:tetratricopeptide repeat-containing glycosyltransferase family protein [Roseomonas sp. E05]MDJ0389790.1 tetratricopeptide repeat-containing glycosyltransferase family protein [Roseomonas sp. E05]
MDEDAERQAEALRRQADSLRDRGAWPAAAAAYAAFLRLRPDDAGMQVQQAHCLKEAGQVAQALALYRSAARLRPEDADIPLQIGHAEKLRGEREAAREAYAQALALDPAAQAPWVEWLALVAHEPRRAASPAGGIVLDLTDLANWIHHGHRVPSGIQRVQLGVALAALAGPQPPRLCAMPPEADGWRDLPPALLHRLAHLMASGTETDAPAWQEAAGLLGTLLGQAPPLRFAPGAVLVALGGTWGMPGFLATLREARARDGLRHVPLLHDCVPLLLPEQCQESTVQGYARWFANLALHAEGVLTVSRSTRDDMRRLHAAMLPELPVPPAAVVRMDAAPRPLPPGRASEHPLLRSRTPFVLFVSTIEGRKDHRLVFSAWLALLRRLGARQVPLLVCVGQPGWRAEAALALLEQAPELRGKVHMLEDVADPLLAALYGRSLFTLYNSLHEGWGLPVTESLAHGRAVLAPGHSALLESGQGAAVFFAAGNEPDLVEKLTQLITDPAFRAEAEARAAAVRLRSWGAVAAQLLAEAERLALPAADGPPRLPLAAGCLHPLRRLAASRPSLAMAVAETVREGEGWYPLEDWGCWTRPGTAFLTLPLGTGHGGALRLELELEGAEVEQPVELQALRNGVPAGPPLSVIVPPRRRFPAGVDVPPGGEALQVEILCREPGQDAAGRPVGIGVRAFGFTRLEEPAERLALLEARHFVAATPLRET